MEGGGEGGEEGGGDKSQQQNFCPPLKKTKVMLNLFFYRSGRFLSIAGIKQALLDNVPSSSDESSGTTDSNDESSDMEDLNYSSKKRDRDNDELPIVSKHLPSF